MTRPHVLLNCRNPKLVAARADAWEGKNPENFRRLLADPRREKRFVRFLELSGVGRTVVDGTDEESAYAARTDTWIAWEAEEEAADRIPPRGMANLFSPFSTCFLLLLTGFVGGAPAPEDLCTAHP
jgi:hypothetical protein